MKKTFTVAIVMGLSFAAALPAQQEAGVQDAIRFERAKDAADARQARIEAQRSPSATASATATAPVEQKPKIEAGVQGAIAFERSKDVADARQARLESQQTSVATARARVNGQR
jgi:hypothetical protein